MSEKLKFQNPITNESTPKKAPNYKLRRAVAATALAGLSAVGAVKALNAMDNGTRHNYDKIEQEAIKEAKQGLNAVVVLREGATFRTAPHTVNPEASGGPDTVAGRVKEGEVLRIDHPVIYTEAGVDENHDVIWYGFTQSQKGDYKESSATENMFWVNATELGRQSTAEHDYIDVYNYHNVAREGFDVVVDKAGNLLADMGNKGGVAGTASMMPENVFEQMVQNEQLELSAGN